MENDRIKIPGCKADLVTDDFNNTIQVATITNNHDRITRLVVKGGYSLTIEIAFLHHNQYQWMNESVRVGLEELVEMGKIAQYLLGRQED